MVISDGHCNMLHLSCHFAFAVWKWGTKMLQKQVQFEREFKGSFNVLILKEPKLPRDIKLNPTNIALLLHEVSQKYWKLTY